MTDYHENENLTQAAPDQPETTEGQLAVRLRDISHTLRALNEGKGSQRRILAILLEAGTITQRELTERLDIRSASASEVIAKLEDTGLITRTPSEEDRRTANVSLTEAGRRQAEEAGQQSRYTEMFSALTVEEKAQLLGLLEKLGTDWGERYPTGRDRHHGGRGHRGGCEGRGRHCGGGHHHGRHSEGRHDHHSEGRREMHSEGCRHKMHEGREEGRHGRHCDHDCEHCAHPCGKGRAKQGD